MVWSGEIPGHRRAGADVCASHQFLGWASGGQSQLTSYTEGCSSSPEAYARLTIFHAESIKLLADAVVAREKDLAPALVIQAMCQG